MEKEGREKRAYPLSPPHSLFPLPIWRLILQFDQTKFSWGGGGGVLPYGPEKFSRIKGVAV